MARPIYAMILLSQNEDLCRLTGVAKASVRLSTGQLPFLVAFCCLWLILYALCGDEETRMKHWYGLKRLDGVRYQVAGIAMMVTFFGFPAARTAVAFAAWGSFDSCREVLILGEERRRQQSVEEARENESSVTISGHVWNVIVVVTAAAYVLALCLVCYANRQTLRRLRKEMLEKRNAGVPKEAGTVEQSEMPPTAPVKNAGSSQEDGTAEQSEMPPTAPVPALPTIHPQQISPGLPQGDWESFV